MFPILGLACILTTARPGLTSTASRPNNLPNGSFFDLLSSSVPNFILRETSKLIFVEYFPNHFGQRFNRKRFVQKIHSRIQYSMMNNGVFRVSGHEQNFHARKQWR